MSDTRPSPFKTIIESAEFLKIDPKEVRKLIRLGLLDARNHGVRKKIVVTVESLQAFSESRKIPPAEAPSLSRFQAARERVLRSLTTQHPSRPLTKGA